MRPINEISTDITLESRRIKRSNKIAYLGLLEMSMTAVQGLGTMFYSNAMNEHVSEENFFSTPTSYVFMSSLAHLVIGGVIVALSNRIAKVNSNEDHRKLMKEFTGAKEQFQSLLNKHRQAEDVEVKKQAEIINKKLYEVLNNVSSNKLDEYELNLAILSAQDLLKEIAQLDKIARGYQLETQQEAGFGTSISTMVSKGYNKVNSFLRNCTGAQQEIRMEEEMSLLMHEGP